MGSADWQHRTADLGTIRLHVVCAGPADGKLVVLLHGFPEFWYSWHHQLEALSAAGYRVLAPDLRGYGESEKPTRVRDYGVDLLADDVARLIRWAGADQADVVAHDWGAMVAWMVANDHPEVVRRLAICNVPHPRRMLDALYSSAAQRKKSWYIFFFQLPFLPERAIARQGFRGLRGMFRRDPVRQGAFTSEDIARYVAALEGGLFGPVSYYRAAFRQHRAVLRRLRPLRHPVLVLWGTRDKYLGEELAEPPVALVPRQRVVKLDASHWVQVDAAEQVNQELLRFLGASDAEVP